MVNKKSVDEASSSTAVNCTVCHHVIIDRKEKSVQCSKCSDWCHVKCTMEDEVFNLLVKINRMKGSSKLVTSGEVAFVCDGCIRFFQTPKLKSSQTQVDLDELSLATSVETRRDSDNISSSAKTTSNQALSSSGDTAPHVDNPQEINKNKKKSTQSSEIASSQQNDRNSLALICYHYKQGRCWHGKTGQKLVNGRICQHLHPEKCLKYCRFGSDKFKGCNGNCGLFHPTLCRNSLKYKQCFSEKCTFAHLSGTERRQRDFPPQINEPSANIYQSGSYQNNDGYHYRSSQRRAPLNNVQRSNANRQEKFAYQQEHFPPLPSVKEDKIAELSLSIRQMQKSIEFIIQSVQLKDGVNQTRDYSNNQATTRTFPNDFNYRDETQMFSQTIPNQPYNQAIRGASQTQTIPNHSSNQAKNH